ncbi:LysR family transcriptional regulator [Pelagibacterium mangrovi]|uniref:LysR family transcriptional regulator n=1 Tax=Pelagibacterium mangrovi TaxID=3119828 RepID=UPI002FC90123
METRFLETFVLVAELGSLAEASRRLGITPVAVAQRMQALEDEVGAQLLIRAGRRVKPTQAGYAILEKGRQILVDIRSLSSLAQLDNVAGDIRLGAISTALTGILPEALRALSATAPDVNAFLLPGTSNDLYRALLDGKIDAALLVQPPFEVAKSLRWKTLRSEPLVVLCRPEHADANPLALLKTEPLIRYDRNNWGGRLPDQYLRDAGIKPRERFELDSLDAIAVMVRSGLGVSLVPDWSVPWDETGSLIRLPVPRPRSARAIGMLWPQSSPAGRLIDVVIEAVESVPAKSAQNK